MNQEQVQLDMLRKWWETVVVPDAFCPGGTAVRKLLPINNIILSALEDTENRKFFFSTAFRQNGRLRGQTKLAAGAIEP